MPDKISLTNSHELHRYSEQRPLRTRLGPERRVRRKPEYTAILGLNQARSDSHLIVFLAERAEIEARLERKTRSVVTRAKGKEVACNQSTVASGNADANTAATKRRLTRLGLIVGRRVGNAPQRNRVKRLLREGFRLLQHELPPGLDVVVMPRPEQASKLTLEQVQASLQQLVDRPLPPSRPRSNPKKRRRGINRESQS